LIENKDLIKIRDMLAKLVNIVDKTIEKDINGCLHDNSFDLTTMGKNNRKFMCLDCEKTWEEEYDEFEEVAETAGK